MRSRAHPNRVWLSAPSGEKEHHECRFHLGLGGAEAYRSCEVVKDCLLMTSQSVSSSPRVPCTSHFPATQTPTILLDTVASCPPRPEDCPALGHALWRAQSRVSVPPAPGPCRIQKSHRRPDLPVTAPGSASWQHGFQTQRLYSHSKGNVL